MKIIFASQAIGLLLATASAFADHGPGTPRADYAGCTHYFCSNRCRTEFVQAPERFVARKK